MGQIKLKTTLISKGNTTINEVEGTMDNGKVTYEENGSRITFFVGAESVNMIVKSDEHTLDLTFKNNEETIGKYILLGTNSHINIDIFTKLLQISSDCIKIIYIFNDEERTYEIEYGVEI